MSVRHSGFARWLLLGISIVFACAGVTILIIRHYSPRPEARVDTILEAEPRKAPLSTNTGRLLATPAATNSSEPEAREDRVVGLVSEGNQLLGQGKYAEAAEKFEQAAGMEPDSEDLHYNLAIALAKLGRTEEAKKHYAEALRIFPEYAEARNNLGNLLMRENKLAEASEQFREALKLRPEDASFHNNLGTAFGRQGKVLEAIEQFTEAVKLMPNYVEARVNLGNACLSAGRVEEAVAQLQEALRLQPDFQPALQAMQRARQKERSGSAPK